ncbi:hypothetical protein FOPG_19133 [Fusarium oxysporum f. sp. conglutinans race 2 54008]|uniref:Uncharacterized protein n=1 Tax=Fusarium oxysporum f. sp. conglutinans race 2 54008 TaxID=1089457 RepID=X0GXP1_FUSOX|nr:hypothetical protein FOPG_19133 [Fusarium oxysporum f. sp. conglutinans race 2 54008]
MDHHRLLKKINESDRVQDKEQAKKRAEGGLAGAFKDNNYRERNRNPPKSFKELYQLQNKQLQKKQVVQERADKRWYNRFLSRES